MMLKTPAAWHCQGGGRRREEADRRSLERTSLDRRSLDRNRAYERRDDADRRRLDRVSLDRMSLDRMSLDRIGVKVKSPVERALDKLLGEYNFLITFLEIKSNVVMNYVEDSPEKLVRDKNLGVIPNPRFFNRNHRAYK